MPKTSFQKEVEKVWVEETIAYPHELFISGKKYDARRKLNGKTLRVIYLKESYIKIITMYWI